MSKKNFREYIEKVRELNSLLEELSSYNYNKRSIFDDKLSDLKREIAFYQTEKEKIDSMKKDYVTRTGVNINDLCVIDMGSYYLIYCRQNLNFPFCYFDNTGSLLYKSKENDKFVYNYDNDFMVAVSNEDLEEIGIGGYTCYWMNFDFLEIKHIPGCQIEEVMSYHIINNNLINFRLANENKINIYDIKKRMFIIKDMDNIQMIEEDCGDFKANECWKITKTLSFDDKDIDFYFYIDNYGLIVSDIFDSNGQCYLVENKTNKKQYVKNLESKFNFIREVYEEKGYQYIKK